MYEVLQYKIVKNDFCYLEKLVKYITDHNDDFKPPISEKVLISDYSKKLNELAYNLTCFYKDVIVGVSCFYCQPEIYEYAYLTYFSVDKLYQNQGIGKKLLEMSISYCKELGIKGIETSSWEGSRAITLYEYFGFKNKISNQQNRVELLLDFNDK